jgi:4-amino-4-deoxy-L-arabinose transferase-like glycosyltransferase
LAAAICLALILPRIAQPGMFVDGVTYAVLARNLAAGVGSFWAPSFSTTVYPVFHEQPPLGIALESLAFRLLGDHLYVERLFSILVFALTAVLIVRLWRRLLPAAFDWLPLLFWVVPSIVTWGAINNMLEATQALFTTLAVLLLVDAMLAERSGRTLIGAAVAGLTVIAAVLTKGPVGLFPLVVPGLTLLIARRGPTSTKRLVLVWTTVLAVTGAAGTAIYAIPEARHALSEFARTHVVPALQGERGLPRRSFDIARHFTLGIVARMSVLLALLWLIRPRSREVPGVRWQVASFFFGVALVASLPLLASPVLAGHYFIPSVPLFALAVATVALPAVQAYRERTDGYARFIPTAIGVALAALAVMVPLVRGPMGKRDADLIQALRAIAPNLPRGGTIGTCASAAEDWGLHNYLQRFSRVSLAATGRSGDGRFLIRRVACAPPPECSEIAREGELALYRCAVSVSRASSDGERFGGLDARVDHYRGSASVVASRFR